MPWSRLLVCAVVVSVVGTFGSVNAQAQPKAEPQPEAQPKPAANADPAAKGDPATNAAASAPATTKDKGEAAADKNAPTTAEAPAAAAGGQSNYNLKLMALEQRVNELKERIFRSKARLNLLKETVLHGRGIGSRAVISHKNEMGSTFRLIAVTYAVDGSEIYSKSDEGGSLDKKKEFEVFNGSITPGNHTISVKMIFRGHGYGIFSYLKGYRFTVRSSHTMTAGEGRRTVLTVRAYEKGNSVTTQMKDRPAIKIDTKIYDLGAKK